MYALFSKTFLYFTLILVALPIFVFSQALVDINTASVGELDALPGIGPAYAQRIIDYRSTNGLFEKIEDIQEVAGIGPSIFANIKDLITVSSVGSEENNDSIPSTTGSNETSQSESIKPSGFSSLSSNNSKRKQLTLSAGKDKIGSVGSPIEFKAEANIEDVNLRNAIKWNFGDGSERYGVEVTHIYEYPGEYIAVLTANYQGEEYEIRLNVKITEFEIVTTLANTERIELKNNSKYEASMFGHALLVGGGAFVFPRDTIIKAGQKISFPSKVTGLRPFIPEDVEILVLGETENPKIIAKIEKQKAEKEVYLKKQISVLQEQIAHVSSLAVEASPLKNKDEEVVEETLPVVEISTQVAGTREGWLSMLKRFFLRNK